MVSWLTSRSKLSLTDLGKIKAFDGTSIQHQFFYALHASAQTKLPPECSCKEVLWRSCAKRADQVGNRVSELSYVEPHIAADGKVNWSIVGKYSMVIHDGVITHLVHKTTKKRAKVADDGFKVSSVFEVKDNHNAMKAALVKGARRYSEFFVKTKGPNAMRMICGNSVVFNTLVTAAIDEKKAAETPKADAAGSHDLTEFHAPLLEKQKEATKRARIALQTRREEQAKKRRVTAQDGASAS